MARDAELRGIQTLNAGRPKLNSVRPNINTGRTNINSVRPKVNAVSPKVNTVRSRQPVPHKTSNSEHPLKNMVDRGNLILGFSGTRQVLACLIAKATSNESKLWHRRLGHINFKNLNKLVKGKLACHKEKDEDVELIVVPSTVRNTEEKAASRKSSTNSKKEEILTELQQEKKAFSTDTSEDNPKIQAFRRELEEIALKHLGKVSENTTTSTTSVNTGSEPVNTGSFDHDDSPMPELEIFHKSDTGIFDEASYDEEGVITDFNSLPTEIEVSPTPTLRIHNIHPKSQILGDPKSAVQTRSKVQNKSGAHALLSQVSKAAKKQSQIVNPALFDCLNKRDKRGVVVRNKARLVAQAEILKKFDLVNVKAAITPMETKLPLTKDEEAIEEYVTGLRSNDRVPSCNSKDFSSPTLSKRIFNISRANQRGLMSPRNHHLTWKHSLIVIMVGPTLTGNPQQVVVNFLGKDLSHGNYCDKHNQVGFLRKPDESAGFAEIVDFLRGSNLRYALTSNPTIYDSLVKQFWQTATANTIADGTLEIKATIDTIGYTITEASIRDTLQLEDATGITMLPNDEIFEGMGQMGGFRGAPRPLLPAMLLVATNPNAGQEHDVVAQSQPSSSTPPVPSTSTPPVPSTSSPPVQSPPPIPASIPTPIPIPETEPEPFEHTFEEPSPVVPQLISRIDSLETDLKQTKLTMGNALVKLVKKVKKLEGFLKRRNMVLSDSEEEEPEAQGRKSQDDPLDSLVQGLVTPSTSKVNASGEEQVEDISPNTLEAAKTLSRVASLKPKSIDKGRRYKRRKETKGKKVVSSLDFQERVNTGAEEVNTAEGVNTGSIKLSTVSEQVSTVSAKRSTPSPDKGQRAGKAPMISEDTPKKSKEQIFTGGS
ncbi:ribonuclease H-like domain-containing protein [Tanacetum coccineum]